MKIQLVYLTLWSLSQAAYISRMTVNRMRVPTAFRPGVTLHRPWNHPRLVQAASHRTPYVIYRNPPHRYAMKHYGPNPKNNRNVFINSGPWKTTARLPTITSATPEYEFVKAASAPTSLRVNGDKGAIHTIPAPNLSLSEKPIVVIDATEHGVKVTTEDPKPTYEVTEKYIEPSIQVAKIESPIGFSKATSLTATEIQNLVRNGAALQLTSEYGLPAIANMPQHQAQLMPQQFTIQQGFSAMPTHQDLVQSGAEGIIIPPNALYQPDPGFLQKLQNQLLQRYPAVEFIPYAADLPTEAQIQTQASQIQPQVILLQNEITKQAPAPFAAREQQNDKNVVQRETQEKTVVTLVPQKLIITTQNVTEKSAETTTPYQTISTPQNITVQVVTESQPSSSVQYIVESTTEEHKTTTPLYYAQVGQSVGSAIASGFFSAINDVRAAAALAQVSETPQESSSTEAENTTTSTSATSTSTTTTTTTTMNPEFQPYFVHKKEDQNNETSGELISVLGIPFAKPEPVKPIPKPDETVKVAYTLYRADDKDQKVAKDGSVYAGQIVEASISEDQDFNKEKNSILSRRAPVRLVAVPAENPSTTTTSTTTLVPQKITVVKAKIPPKSKLTFDDKTGEPVLRIYASYVDTPQQKEVVVSKLANMKQKEVTRKTDSVDSWKAATIKSVDKTQGPNMNQVTQFGLKLRSRSDDYIPLFDDYED
ncbi:uncharacterized protein LOC133520802 isoform X3 [Cydia pomonella]|uniref:uncharacterized protein LOC133520802 isoform X3 n=1 Tax=Cydia pomonella TaxID=82600 RepID=UPI002ADDB953|nr:uncharacterized protein LOC133520802 isoform X3 [Cydia pomonella]